MPLYVKIIRYTARAKRAFKREVGTMSREPVEVCIWETMTVSSSNEIGLNGLNREIQARLSTPEVQEGNILDFM